MASDDTMTINSSTQYYDDDDDDDDDVDYGNDDHHHPHNLSRLSMCSNNNIQASSYGESDDAAYYGDGDVGDDSGTHHHDMGFFMSRLSIEGSDGDADEEFSDEKETKGISLLSSDSDKETGTLSLPATPPRRRRRGFVDQNMAVKEYASENEAHRVLRSKMGRNNSRRRFSRERWVERCWEKKRYNNNMASVGGGGDDQEMMMIMEQSNNFSVESECLVITRPKGGKRSLCMDLEEVKACRDLGFELEHERMLEVPTRISMSGSTIDTASSGGNSPIANWRISSPGDNPKDVKARIKKWAQAVALASTSSRHLS